MAAADDDRSGPRARTLLARLAALTDIRRPLTPAEAAELRAVFAVIHTAQFQALWERLRRRGLPQATAEDLAQEALAELYLEIVEKGFPDEIRAYLFKIAEGKLLNHWHAQHRAPVSVGLPSSGSTPPISGPEMERALDLKAFREQLREELSEGHVQVAELCLINRLTSREAAAILGIAEGTVSSRLRRAKEVIARLVKRWLPPSQRC